MILDTKVSGIIFICIIILTIHIDKCIIKKSLDFFQQNSKKTKYKEGLTMKVFLVVLGAILFIIILLDQLMNYMNGNKLCMFCFGTKQSKMCFVCLNCHNCKGCIFCNSCTKCKSCRICTKCKSCKHQSNLKEIEGVGV